MKKIAFFIFCLILLNVGCKSQNDNQNIIKPIILGNHINKQDSIIIKYVPLYLFTYFPTNYKSYKEPEEKHSLFSAKIIKDSTEIARIKMILKSLNQQDSTIHILSDVKARMILYFQGSSDTVYFNDFHLDLDGDKFYKTPEELIQYIKE